MSTLKKIDALWRATKERLRDEARAKVRMLADQIRTGRWDKSYAEKRAAIKARRERYGSSMYVPHQGEREKARRRRQLAAGILQL